MKKFLITLILLFAVVNLTAAPVTVEWSKPVGNNDIAGYHFEHRSESGVAVVVDVGLRYSHTVDLIVNKKYAFIVTPYSRDRLSGRPSTPIYHRVDEPVVAVKLPTPQPRVKHVRTKH